MNLESNRQQKKIWVLPLMSILTLLMSTWAYAAPPIKPASFYGSIKLNTVSVPEGTFVTGWIGNIQVAQTNSFTLNGESRFRIHISGDDPDTPEIEGGVEGQTITFKIDGYDADQTAIWQSGTFQRLDLTAIIPPAPPVANFTTGKAKNVALLEDGAQVIDYSSAFNTTSSYTPDNAIDYDSSATGFSSWRTASTGAQNEWLKVELAGQQPHIIDRVVLRSPGDYPQNFEVRVSTTGTADSDFSTVYAGVYAPNTGRQSFTFPPVAARYVQLYILDGDGSSDYIRLAEFQVWTRERAGGIVSLSAGPPSTIVDVSSFVTGFEPEKAIDDDASVSSWKTASGDATNQWFTVALGGGSRTYRIDHVRLQGSGFPTMPRNFAIRVSNTTLDEAAFTTVFEGTLALDYSAQEFYFPPVDAKYVQLFVVDNFDSGCCVELKDFDVLSVYGTNTSRLGGVGASIVDSSPSGAERTIDNNLITGWSASPGSWFKLRLIEGGPYPINHLKVNATSAQSAQFELAVSDQTSADADFTTVYTGTFRADGIDHWLSFPDVPARYVRFAITSINGSSITLRDLQLYSSALGGATVPLDNYSFDSDGIIINRLWEFGDGQSSIEEHPVHEFAAPGEYPIQLTVTDTDGLSTTQTLTYTVLTPPQADFAWTPDPAFEGQIVTFTDTSVSTGGQILTQIWDSPILSAPEVNKRFFDITFPDSGDYPLTLTVSDSQLLTASISQTVPINNLPPTVSVGPDQTLPWGKSWLVAPAVSDPSPADQLALVCDWDFGDGNSQQINGCKNNNVAVSHTYDTPGVYTATLSVTDPDGDTGTDTLLVTVLAHNTYIHINSITALTTGNAEVVVTLYDQLTGALLPGQTIEAAADGATATQTTDAQGQATLLLAIGEGSDIPLQISYPGDTHYNASITTDVVSSGPDLVVESIDLSQTATDAQELLISGDLGVQIINQGNLATDSAFQIVVFEDRDQDGVLSASDNVLGQSSYDPLLVAGQSVPVIIPVDGPVLFRDSPIYAVVDSDNIVSEANEQNNITHTCQFCEFAPPAASPTAFQPELEWAWIDEIGFFNGVQLYGSMMTPVVAPLIDTNGDSLVNEEDVPAIIFIPYGNRLVAVRGDNGATIFDQATYPVGQGEQFSQLAVGDIDNDNLPEIITVPSAPASNGTRLIAFENDGTFKWLSEVIPFPRFDYGGVSLADLDHDGSVEIVAGATVLDSDGQILWSGGYGVGNGGVCCLSAVADIDLDGTMEVIAGKSAYRSDGQLMWHYPNGGDGWPAIGNFDADPFAEIITISFNFIVLREHDGSVIWSRVIDGSSGSRCGPPTIANFDLDSEPEIGVACGQGYYVFEGDSTLKWSVPVQDGSSGITGSSVFDFNGDGIAEVVYNDELYLRVFRGTDGEILFEIPNSSGTLLEYPVVADVDLDGNAEIVVVSNNNQGFADQVGLTEFGVFVYEDVLDNWVKTRSIWNQHTYHISNINDDGTIPLTEEPSWLTHNSYRANLSLDLSPLAAPDLTASRLVVTPLTAGGAALTVRVGNGGLNLVADGIPVAFYNGDPDAGGSLIGVEYTQQTLHSGDYEDVTIQLANAPTDPFEIFVRVDDDGQGIGTENECNENNNSHNLAYAPGIDLAISKDSPFTGTLLPGENISFTLTVENLSSSVANNIEIIDTLPTHTSVVSVSGSGTEANGEVSWTVPSLNVGETVSETIVLQLDAPLDDSVTVITNTGRVQIDPLTGNDPNPVNDESTITIPVQPNRPPVAVDDNATTLEEESVIVNVLANDTDSDNDALLVESVSSPINGSATIQPGGTILYVPDTNFNGTDSFDYTISDGRGGTGVATVTVTVTPVNDEPVAVDDAATTDEDTAVTVDVLANDNDLDGDTLSILNTTQPGNGSVTVNPDNTVTYTPDPDFNSSDNAGDADSFTYTISDGNGATATAIVSVTVNPINDAPDAIADTATTAEDTSLTIDVLANDYDVEGDSLTVVSVTQPINGSATINPDNTITYQPALNYFGNDSFTYTVEDGNGGSATATVSITVQPVNDPPTASDDSVSSAEDTPVTIDILANDTDVENDALTVVSNSPPANGTVVLNADNTATYTPDENFNGSDSFTYTIQDGNGGTDSATVNLTITPVNDAPVAEDDSATTNEDTDVTIPVLTNDKEFDGDTLSVTSTTSPQNGEIVVNEDNTITYTPESNFYGSDSFTYTVGDGTGLTDTGTVLITVSPVNDAPDTADDVATTDEDSSVVIDVLANDSDIEGDSLSITSLTTPAQGTATVNPDNTITYAPNANYFGTDSFSYSVADSQGGTATAMVTVTIEPVNDTPQAADDSVSTPEDTAAVVNVLANDSDIDGDLLTVLSATQPVNGTVIVNADQTITYTPAPSFNGTDTFVYTVSDGAGGSASATVSVTVSAENDNPEAVDDNEIAAEDAAVTIDVLANDSDIDGDSLTIASLTQPANGQATTNGADVTYTPDANYFGFDTFTYTVSDGNGGSDTATVAVEVSSVNDAPDAVNDSATTAEDTAVTIRVLANDSDIEGDSLTITAVSSPGNGNAVSNGVEITYTPDANFNGSDSFTYTISDGNGGSDTAVVNLTITTVNDDPTAVDDTPVTPEDTAITFSPLVNDSDVDGDPITIVSISIANNGSAVLNPDQTVTYTPDANFAGSDSFSYTIEDDQGGSATAKIMVVVLPTNDAPVAVNDSAVLPEDGTVVIDVLANDSDVENDTLTVTSLTSPANGVAIINLDYTITYTPTANFFGADSFSYTIDDGNGGTATADVSIEVTSVNDAPVALNDSAATTEDTPVQIDVLSNDTDVDGGILTITGVTTPTQGTVAINPDGTLTYTPDPDTYNADTFDYSIEDGNGGTATATVTVAVNPVNDAPVAEDDSVTTPEDTAVTIAVLSNDSDVDGSSLSVSSVTTPTLGTVVINSDNSLTYTPYLNVYGSDSFTYTIIDGFGGMDTATVSISISPVNDNPVAVDDSRVTPEDTAVTIDVLANDTDVDGDDLAVSSVTSPTNGTAVINLDNTLTYTPAPSYFGNDSFTYTIDDGNGGSADATVTITVSAENDNPVAVDDTASTDEDVEIIIDVLGNDTDQDNDILSISNVTQPANGTTSINNGEILYSPDANFNGTDTFVYTVIDGAGGSDDGTVVVTITPINDAPVAIEDSATTDAGASVTIDVLANDSDIEADPLFIASISQATNGTVVANPDDTITYTPNPGFSGIDSFTYTVSDGALSDTAVVTITVTPVAASCELYPIALHETSLSGAQVGDMITDILNGEQPGNFGWLTWNGDNSVPALVSSLTMPGNSHIYVNPNDPNDHVVSIGDWVEGKPGVSNSKKVRNALDALIGENIVVPVWSASEGSGANTVYLISGFAEVQLVDYQLPGQDSISAIYLGPVTCSDAP
ncbi:MAG: tandem-95 repeat protein [Ardenticatenaceae bacterium]|nr:tandem-95 repeat protein [Ardenticatenaceae bacterium]